jgi:DNA-binding transcriptional ArsR family regulator
MSIYFCYYRNNFKDSEFCVNIDIAAKALKELGHPTRLTIFKRLVRGGDQGIPVGILQSELKIPGSTLSHHISSLVSASLVIQERKGRILFCKASYKQLRELMSFLQEQCCIDEIKPLDS